MKLMLSSEQDILKYVKFLSSSGKLGEVMGDIVLDDEDTEMFLGYKTESEYTNLPVRTVPIMYKSWSEEEDRVLFEYTQSSVTPATVAELMDRTEGSIRSRAIKSHDRGYRNSSWYDIAR